MPCQSICFKITFVLLWVITIVTETRMLCSSLWDHIGYSHSVTFRAAAFSHVVKYDKTWLQSSTTWVNVAQRGWNVSCMLMSLSRVRVTWYVFADLGNVKVKNHLCGGTYDIILHLIAFTARDTFNDFRSWLLCTGQHVHAWFLSMRGLLIRRSMQSKDDALERILWNLVGFKEEFCVV